MDKLAKILMRKEGKKFSELHTAILIIIGSISFLIAGYWGFMLSTVIPDMIKETNEYGFPPLATALWFFLGLYSLIVWYFGCIATRCHTIIYERWFK